MSKNVKIYAMFLPQFHQTEENDNWWGKGFTEWNNVKSAKPLFKGHKQPILPIGENYYDLSKVDTLKSQADLAQKYKVDGFCIYHYYSEGKCLLDVPIKNLYNHPEINVSYFFSWANHDWRRTWYSFNNEILFKQEYGDKESRKRHYEYCRDFFLDNRYLKIDNKPVFVIYKTLDVIDFDLMREEWNSYAQSDGFEGVLFVSTIGGFGIDNKNNVDAYYSFEPDASIALRFPSYKRFYLKLRLKLIPRINKIFGLHIIKQKFNYDDFLKINKKEYNTEKPLIRGAFAKWDNTARHSYNGRIVKNCLPEKFKKYLSASMDCVSGEFPIVIINSWNEWSEGSNIEPDIYNQYAYLEAIGEIKDAKVYS